MDGIEKSMGYKLYCIQRDEKEIDQHEVYY